MGFDPHALHQIYVLRITASAAAVKVFLAHSPLETPAAEAAIPTAFSSSSLSRMQNILSFAVPVFGLPLPRFLFSVIRKMLDPTVFPYYEKSTTKRAMANNLPSEKKVLAVSMLCEGSSIRAIERVTGIHRDTIMRLGVRVGDACKRIMDEKLRNIPAAKVQVDEIWGFVGAKRRNAQRVGAVGDVWTFIALDSDTKLIPSFIVGKRDAYHAKAFMEDLASRLSRRVQLSSDAMAAYPEAVERGFGSEVDYGQIVKTYSVTNLNKDAASRYSPADVVSVEKTVVSGMPDVRRISTSHIESQNLTLRMHCRRLTRLTNAFSKKLENFEAAVALNFAYYNFCKTHTSLRMTPAQAAKDRKSVV